MFGVPVSAGGLSRVRFSRTAEALALPRAPLFGFDGPGAAAAGPGHARAAASGVGCLPDAADAAPTRRGTNSAAGSLRPTTENRADAPPPPLVTEPMMRRRRSRRVLDSMEPDEAAVAFTRPGADDAARRAADGAAAGRTPASVTVPHLINAANGRHRCRLARHLRSCNRARRRTPAHL